MNSHLTESELEPETKLESEESDKNISSGPGERLKKCRESMKLTRVDIATRLNLRINIIEALEKDDYKYIPKSVFARGYLRSYAKLLNLPPNEIVDSFNLLEWPENPIEFPRAPLRTGQKKAAKKEYSAAPWIALVALILIFAVAGLWKPITQILNINNNKTVHLNEEVIHAAPPALQKKTDISEETEDTENMTASSQARSSILPDLGDLKHEE